jgi:hypothetical protein
MARRELDQYTVPRKVPKVRWLEGSAFPQSDLHFATALHLDGKAGVSVLLCKGGTRWIDSCYQTKLTDAKAIVRGMNTPLFSSQTR